MPIIWEARPDVPVTLLGSYPTDEVKALASDRVTVTGYIQDVTPYFLSHRVFVSPLRYGAGMKGKIGQSLEYKLPIVSTSIGIEGMNLVSEREILIANNTEDFAMQVSRLYSEESLWKRLAANAEKAISYYSPEAVRDQLGNLLRKLIKSST